MTVLALSIGSNVDAESNIRAALVELTTEFRDIRCSTTYESHAVGFEGDNFLNLAVLIDTEKGLSDITAFLKQLEDKLGRDRKQVRFSGRTIDIDILLFGTETAASCGIELPRPEITENAFVLQPLAELLPHQIHSATGFSYQHLWQHYDKSKQQLWPIEINWSLENRAL